MSQSAANHKQRKGNSMIYKFKCKATDDLLMAGPVGDRTLGILDEPVAARGVLQPGDMVSAIRALDLAIADDEARLSVVMGNPALEEDAAESADAVTIRQHTWPLIEMLKQAQAADEVIVWGV